MIQAFTAGAFKKVDATKLTRNFGNLGQKTFILGFGTPWFGRPWPPSDPQYTYPAFDEVNKYLDQIFRSLDSIDGQIMIDTASEYGSSEEKIGRYFKANPQTALRALIATKWGGSYDVTTDNNIINYSKENLINSVNQSIDALGRIDVLYLHGIGSPDNILNTLCNQDVINKMERLRQEQIGGIRYLGMSISSDQVLEDVVRENLFKKFDIIQLPSWLFIERQDLISQLKNSEITFVLNSPVRLNKGKNPQKIYRELLAYPEVANILTGTRHHLLDTLMQVGISMDTQDSLIPAIESAGNIESKQIQSTVHAVAKPEQPSASVQEIVQKIRTQIKVQDIPKSLSIVFDGIKNIVAKGGYGEICHLNDTINQEDYKQLIQNLVKLSWQKKDDQKYLENLNHLGELVDIAYLLSCVTNSRDNDVWLGLEKFYNKSLNLNQLIPRSRLFTKGSFTNLFNPEKIQYLFHESHQWLFGFIEQLLIEKARVSQDEFENITHIGLTNFKSNNLGFIFQYYRPGEIASIIKEGFPKPQRYEKAFDPDEEGLADLPIAGIHYLVNGMAMYVLREIKTRQDMKGIISPFYSVGKDPLLNQEEQVIIITSGLFYDQQGRLTLAEFTRGIREDYSIVHVRDTRIEHIRQTGVPTPFSPILGSLSYEKKTYNEFYADSGLPFPVQTVWPLESTQQSTNSQLYGMIKQHLILFAKENNLASVYIKPGQGSAGDGVKKFVLRKNSSDNYFDEQILDQAIDHIAHLGDDAIIQAEIIKLNFRELLQESIDLGYQVGTPDSLLEEIFGHPVGSDVPLDWVIRHMVARQKNNAAPFVAARRIIVNDQGVANTGKGGKIINVEDWVPQLGQYLPEYDSIIEKSISYATTHAEKQYPDEIKPLDGASVHETELSTIDGIIDTQRKMILIEIDHSFVPNMWRVDTNRAEWGQKVLDRTALRMCNYRAALGVSDQRYPYNAYQVNSIINRNISNIHEFQIQTEIFDALQNTYNSTKNEQIIVERIIQARKDGQEIVVGIGGLGIAGIGPSILQAAAEKITDTTELKSFIQKFYQAHINNAPAKIVDALWRLNVISEEDTLSVSQAKGALTQLKEAQDLIGAQESASLRDRLRGAEAQKAQQNLYESLQKYDDFRDTVNQIIEQSPKQPIYSVFAVQPLSSPPRHGYFIGLVNNAIFPHGINDGGLKAILPKAHPRLYATPSRKAVEYADTIIVTIRLDVEPSEPGKYRVAFGPLMKEIEEFASPLSQGIKNAQQEGRKPPTIIVVTTQGPGTSATLIKALEKGLKNVSRQDYKGGRDFYFVHAPSNIDPGKNWVNSLSKTPQPISGINHKSIESGVRFFNGYNHNVKVYRGPQSLEQVEFFKVFRNVCAANSIANASIGSHSASLVGAFFPEISDHIHEVAGMGKVRKLDAVPSHHLPRAEAGVGGPCLYKESEIIQTLGTTDTKVFGHQPTLFTDFLAKVTNTSILTFMYASRQINELQPYYVAGLTFGALEKKNIPTNQANIAIAGIAYKRDMGGDTRHTPALDVIMGLLGDPLHLRAKPRNLKAVHFYLTSHNIPQITMIDPDVSYFSEVDQRAGVPNITGLSDQTDGFVKQILGLAEQAKEFLIKHKDSLKLITGKDGLRALEPQADQYLIDYISDFFFLSDRGPAVKKGWRTLAGSAIEHDIWRGVQNKDVLVLCQGHQLFKDYIKDLPRLAKTLKNPIIVDAVNFMDKNMIQDWQALGGIYMGVGKANPFIDYLEQNMANYRDNANELLMAKKQGDMDTMQNILDSLQQNLSLDIVTNHPGDLAEKQALLKIHQGIKPQELTWDMWYYIGGKYYLAGEDEQGVEATKQIFKIEVN